ncbi:bifunctional 2-polyprenyl-6-hydroxyphenol methylase/3-demethylubiquinol 3-O-methyltransferase UbiG [Nostoc sp. T09]|uniref:class I SAM-dependent methyltransferase n=1 Tax=Nostoc sp. T09 TaxID=1932621 RepID=UPI0026B5942D|nr:class I SAM-dependent methyltransferase [Nostoc sp. T09]
MTKHPLTTTGQKALVIGCGLGDDAEALAQRGFEVTAFDISPTAIAWSQQRFPHSTVNYVVEDLLAIPSQWHLAFDLVFECRNIQALPLSVRSSVISTITSVVAPGGKLLVINRFRETEAEPSGPPWPLSNSELAEFEKLGLHQTQRFVFLESEQLDVKQLLIEYQRRHPATE